MQSRLDVYHLQKPVRSLADELATCDGCPEPHRDAYHGPALRDYRGAARGVEVKLCAECAPDTCSECGKPESGFGDGYDGRCGDCTDAPSTLGTGHGLGAHYERAFEHAAENMPGRMGDPVAELAHEFAQWATAGGWETGSVADAFTAWIVDVKAPVRPGLAGD